jgi:hypothetical protein
VAFLFFLRGFDEIERPSQRATGLMCLDTKASFCFAQQAVALWDFLKRCDQFDEQDDVLWLRFLWRWRNSSFFCII